MSLLDDIIATLLGSSPTVLRTTESNVLRHPATTPATRTGTLVRADAGVPTDTIAPERVVVLLGPGATFEGIATSLLPLFPAATAGGVAPPPPEQLARALVVYAKDYLPAGDWSHHEVGLRLPLPIEIDPGSGDWIVNANTIRTLAARFLPAWRSRLRAAPTALPVPDAFALEVEAAALISAFPPVNALGAELATRTLRNPYAAVFLVLAVLRALDRATPAGQSTDVALAILGPMSSRQADLLADTRAGNGILRRLADIMAKASPGADPARLLRITAARALLKGALFHDGLAGPLVVPHRELPETPEQQLRPGPAEAVAGATDDPAGGAHRLVLGRDLAVGAIARRTAGATTYAGPELTGRVSVGPYLIADAVRLDPPGGDARIAALHTVLGRTLGIGALDAVSARGPGLLTVGLDHWAAVDVDALPTLLLAYKKAAPDEFDLFFVLHGLDVDAPDTTHAARGRLLKLDALGTPSPIGTAALQTFLGGQVASDGSISLAPEWAARFRLPALTSLAYRRVQVAQAVARLNRVTPTPRVDDLAAPVPKLAVPLTEDDLVNVAGVKTYAVTSSSRALSKIEEFQFARHGFWIQQGKVLITHGLFVPDPVDATQFLIPTPMRVVFPEDGARPGQVAGTGKLPVVVIVHGNHAAFDPIFNPPTATITVTNTVTHVNQTFPLVDSASSVTNVPNHEGYGRLQDLLATVGIVSVSVSTNAANAFNRNIRMRSLTVIAALEHLKQLNTDPASRYLNRLDLKKVGLMGHSRGGDVVVDVARQLQGHADFTVKAVCSLAPTDFTGTAVDATQLKLTPADAAFYLVVYGALDGDVSGLGGAEDANGSGFRHYDRATCPKAMVQLSRCCHNRFNSVWSDGTPAVPADPLKKFQGDDDDIMDTDVPTLRSFEDHQKLEVEYVGAMFRWQLLGDPVARDLFDGTRPNTVGVPASLQWSFGGAPRPTLANVDDVVALDDLENPTTPSRPGATRTLGAGGRIGFADVTVPQATLTTGGSTSLVRITEHATHPSQVLRVDASGATTTAVAMTLGFAAPAADGTGPGNWRGFTFLTFLLSYTLDISSAAKLTASPTPKTALKLTDRGGRSRRLADATAFSLGVPSRPELHLVKHDIFGNLNTSNATLFRFETVRVPLLEFARHGVHVDNVKELAIEFDQTVKTRVMFDSFQLVAF